MARKLARTETEKFAKQVSEASKKPIVIDIDFKDPANLIPTGATLLNLACSDNPFGGYVKGTIVNLIGDTSAGKSFLALTMLAEICNNKRFDKYDLYYDDVEKTFEFDFSFFGKKFEKRIIFEESNYAEEIGDVLFKLSNGKKKFIYVTDSWDGLKSKYEEKKEKVNIGKRARGQEEEGSYGDGKAKILHKICRQTVGGIERLESLWVIVSQTKDNWGFDAMFNPTIVTGGNAIKFFPSHRVWLTTGKKERLKKRIIGGETKAKVVKNKFTGKKRDVFFPIYDDYGPDDIGSCVRFLNGEYAENHWKTRTKKIDDKSLTAIDAKDFDLFLKELELIKYIEDNNLEKELKLVVGKVWNDIEDSIRLDRKPRFI